MIVVRASVIQKQLFFSATHVTKEHALHLAAPRIPLPSSSTPAVSCRNPEQEVENKEVVLLREEEAKGTWPGGLLERRGRAELGSTRVLCPRAGQKGH